MNTSIKLSELCSMETPPAITRGIICDEASFTPPNGVRIAAFTYEIDHETGEYKEDLMDTLVAWGVIARTNVLQERKIIPIVEIPFSEKDIPVEQALHFAAAGSVSLSLMLPEEQTAENMTEWSERVVEFGKNMLHTTDFAGRVYPFNDFLEVVFLEAISENHAKQGFENIWNDHFGNVLTKTYSKEVFGNAPIANLLPKIREAVHQHFGGEANFREFAKQIPGLCWEKTEDAVNSNIRMKKASEASLAK